MFPNCKFYYFSSFFLAENKKMHYLWIDCLVDEKFAEILKEDHVKTNEMKSF